MRTNKLITILLTFVILTFVGVFGCGGGEGGGGGTTSTSTVTKVNLPQTGQAISYDANTEQADDGALRKGIAWPKPRFTMNGDTTVTDDLTGLAWPPNGNIMPTRDNNWDQDGTINDGQVTWQHALDYVAKLNAENYLGHADWRMPNMNEIESLVHAGYLQETCGAQSCRTNAAWLNTQGFSNVQPLNYWSSTTCAGISDPTAWIILMEVGGVFFATNKSQYYYVWPIRSGGAALADLPRTGQSLSYAPGDDGDKKMGVVWPAQRFTGVSSGTGTAIKDNLTGLMWPSIANTPTMDTCIGGPKSWQSALNYVACLNTHNYLGHNDWRLPNSRELRSLINYGQSDSAHWMNIQGFSNVQSIGYWSSTSYAGGSSYYAWFVDMMLGSVLGYDKNNSLFVLPVRDGQ